MEMQFVTSVDGSLRGLRNSPSITRTRSQRPRHDLSPLVAGTADRWADRQADRVAGGLLGAGRYTDYRPVDQRTMQREAVSVYPCTEPSGLHG